ncbi:MAG: Peptidase family M50 [Candidatus Bathyarchaeota archaeon BA1]|nr:MAG: Peptidase family M50 [Candidatus Bathyarchaeota archaeon BA1]
MSAESVFPFIVVVFWVVLYVIGNTFHLKRHGLEIRPAYLTYKSRGLRELLYWVSRKGVAFWRILCNVGLVLAVGQMIFGIYFLTSNLLRFAYPLGEPAPVFLVLPGITIRLYWLPYFFTSMAILIMTHELAHGVAAIVEGIPVKSTGLLLLLVFFGGFVEPDKKQFERSPTLSKLRVLSAGSSTNLLTGFLVLLLLMGIYAPPSGVLIHETLENGPAERSGLKQWDVIYAINGNNIFTIRDFENLMANVPIGKTLILNTSRGSIAVTSERGAKNRAVLGLISISNYHPSRLGLERLIGIHLYMTLHWIFLIALSIAVFNMLPIYPWDGDKFLYHALRGVVKKRRLVARMVFNAIFWSLVAVNMILTFMKHGWLSV